jgi:hypothetical protein
MGWHLTVMSRRTVLFTADTPSRREIEDLAIEARRLRPDVKIFIRTPDGATTPKSDPRQLELELESPR